MRRKRASKTAAGVAQWLVFAGADPRVSAILPEGWLERGIALLRAAGRLGSWDRLGPWRRRRLRLSERLWLPGISVHLALRKRFVDDEVRAAVQAGARQLVVLGAGFDPLALRVLDEHADLACFEIDHPATHAVKARALAALVPDSGIELLPVDLVSDGFDEALRQHAGFRPELATVFVAEGLLMYLEESVVERVLASFRSLAAPGSRLVFSYAELGEDGRDPVARFPWVQQLRLKMVGEPFLWAPTVRRVDELLATHGLRRRETCEAALRAELLQGFQPWETVQPLSERFVVVEHAD